MEALSLGVMIAAAAAGGDGDLISGKMLAALFAAIFAGGGGIWIGRKGGESAAEKSFEKREQEIRAQISNELRAKIVNDPLHVQQQGPFVTVGECKQHRCALEKRIDALGPALNRIFKKLNANDQRSEERSVQLHRRLDPVVEKLAATSATVEMMKGQKK